jgi:putative ABC transport system permease protein
MRWVTAARTRLRLLVGRRDAESRMNGEFGLHIELETEHLVASGVEPAEARRRALVAFGGVERHKEAMRDGRGLAWLDGFALDLRLAARLLRRYPWLTLVGGAAIAFGIAAGVGTFEIRTQIVNPTLPLDEGSRIVGLRNRDTSLNRVVPATMDDVDVWRTGLTRVEEISASRALSRNLLTSDGKAQAESVAAMSASAFRLARVAPIAGRTLIDADEDSGAPPVVVIGHEVWHRRFGGDATIVGQRIRLGADQPTVVGIMPEHFTFPSTQQMWIPLSRRPALRALVDDPGLLVFGRLAAATSAAQAQTELSVVASRRTASPAAKADLRSEVVPFTRLMFDSLDLQIGLALGNIFVVMLLLLVCANVALLTFARAATRATEIAVRTALGASRLRIVTQLFLEGLVLAGLAVATGLAVARYGLQSILAVYRTESGSPLPFWMSADLTTSTVIYAGALTLITAAIIGVLPALKVTGRGHLTQLRQSSAGGGGVRLSGVWTAVIAAQVATTVMFPAAAFFFHRWVTANDTRDIGFPASRYLAARIELDRDTPSDLPLGATEQAFHARLGRAFVELERRVSAEATVSGVTFTDRLPGTYHSRWRIQTDGEMTPGSDPFPYRVASASVALNYFAVLGAPLLAGRTFTAADVNAPTGVVIVNTSFVDHVLGGQNPIGRHIRRGPNDDSPEPGPWLEIVGVVKDLGLGTTTQGEGLYRPLALEAAPVVHVAVGVTGQPAAFAARMQTLANEVDPTLQLHELMPLDELVASQTRESGYMSRIMIALSVLALVLSLTAIYSVTAFAVSRRTREIGIRVALGAERRRVIGPILRRPLFQVGLGIVAGAILVTIAFIGIFEGTPTVREMAIITAYSLLMMLICLVACVGPVRRALTLAPAEILRSEA